MTASCGMKDSFSSSSSLTLITAVVCLGLNILLIFANKPSSTIFSTFESSSSFESSSLSSTSSLESSSLSPSSSLSSISFESSSSSLSPTSFESSSSSLSPSSFESSSNSMSCNSMSSSSYSFASSSFDSSSFTSSFSFSFFPYLQGYNTIGSLETSVETSPSEGNHVSISESTGML